MRVLRKRMSGEDVRGWQEFLNSQGFSTGTADGIFGDGTFNATVQFQRRNGLGDDGVVGQSTVAKARQLGFVESTGGGGGSNGGGEPLGAFTEQALAQIMPNLNSAKRAAFFPFLVSAMREFDITTPLRQAAFVAQLAHESGQFRFMEEIWGPTAAQRRYEGRHDLGNTRAGDGFRFKGRGPIQITGRANYKRYGDMLGIDLVNNPAVAAKPEVGFRTAGLYWKSNGCNALADGQQFVTITRRINGGTNGLNDRVMYYDRAKRALGISGTRSINDITRGAQDEGEGEGAVRLFTRGLDSPGEITPTAEERNAEQPAWQGRGGGAAKKPASKRGAAKKSGANKAAARKSPARGAGTSKPPAKKATAKKSAAKSTPKKTSGGKSAKKSAAKKTTARKSGAKKSTAKGSGAKKPAKSAAKKGGARKSVPSRSSKSGARAGATKGSGRSSGKAAKGAGKSAKLAGRAAAKRGAKGAKTAGRGGRR